MKNTGVLILLNYYHHLQILKSGSGDWREWGNWDGGVAHINKLCLMLKNHTAQQDWNDN